MSLKHPRLTVDDAAVAAMRLRNEQEFQERIIWLRNKYQHLLKPRVQGRGKNYKGETNVFTT